jgi:hypothetical protein
MLPPVVELWFYFVFAVRLYSRNQPAPLPQPLAPLVCAGNPCC